MKRSRASFVWTVSLALLATSAGAQSLPQEFNYQGRVAELDGTPVNGLTPMTFRLYDLDQGGVPAWEEAQTVEVDEGVFSVRLGAVNPLSVDFAIQLWLEIEVDGDLMATRLPLVPVPYAHHAVDAELLDGVVPSEYEESDEIADAVVDHVDEEHGGPVANGGWLQVDASVAHQSCGLREDGHGWAWGAVHAYVEGPLEDVACGQWFLCGVRDDQSLACAGRDNLQQASPPAGTFSAVTAGHDFACATRTDQTAECWGQNNAGQTSPPPQTLFTAISAAYEHVCGIRTDGGISCWGSNDDGQLNAPAGSFTAVGGGTDHSCGVYANGSVECWGDNAYNKSWPAPAGTYVAVDGGDQHTCAIRTDGGITCWGRDEWAMHAAPAGSFASIGCGAEHCCASSEAGAVMCWGHNDAGQCSPQP